MLAIWRRALSLREIKSLHTEPYALAVPTMRRISTMARIGLVPGPYDVDRADVFLTGQSAADIFAAGQTAGDLFVAGQAKGQTHG